MGSNIEKSNITIAILEKLPFLKIKIFFSYFDGSNIIFADCTLPEQRILLPGALMNTEYKYRLYRSNK